MKALRRRIYFAINLYPGREPEVKQAMAEKVKNFFAEELEFPLDTLSVSVVEVEPEVFVETMHENYKDEDLMLSSKLIK